MNGDPATYATFAIEEFRGRVSRVQQDIADRELDAVLFTRPQNIYYLTGFRSLGSGLAAAMGQILAVLIPASGEPRLFLRALEAKIAYQYCWCDVEAYRDYEDSYAAIARHLPGEYARLGIEFVDITALQLRRLRDACPSADIQDASLILEPFRREKSPQEQIYVREAAHLANLGLRTAINATKVGERISTVIGQAVRAMYDAGQDDITWPPALVWAGPDGGLMNSTFLNGSVEAGDLVTIEITGISHLYTAVAMGTVCAGSPSKAVADAYEVAVALHDAARGVLRPGITGDAIHAECDRIFQDAGQGPYSRRVGSLIGINAQPSQFSEGVNLLKGDETELRAGMVALVQPGVDKPGMMVVASTSLITDRGYEELTEPIRNLVSSQ